jgi:hypothetical protein
MISAQSREFLRLFRFYRNNILPFSGGLYDQPAKFMQAMEIIEQVNVE